MTRDSPYEYRDRAVYLPDADALVLADLHLGRDAASNVELPLGERERIPGRIGDLLAAFGPGEAVLAGDVLHSFSRMPAGVRETVGAIRDLAADAGADLVVLRGNHDAMLDAVADPAAERRLDDGTVVCHGHEAPDAGADRYVIGHDHPAIEIEGVRRPCYLLGEGTYRGADVLCLPAFTRLAAGTPVNGLRAGDLQSPLLPNPDVLRPVVRDEEAGETLRFPPLGSFRGML